MKRFLHDLTFLVALLSIVVLAAYIPYHVNTISINSNHKLIEIQRKNEAYACKLNNIFKLFVSTATDTRVLLANQSSFTARVRAINLHTAKIFKEIQIEIQHLPPNHCNELRGG